MSNATLFALAILAVAGLYLLYTTQSASGSSGPSGGILDSILGGGPTDSTIASDGSGDVAPADAWGAPTPDPIAGGDGTGDTGTAPPPASTGAVWLPGDNHTYDNQFVFAAEQMTGDSGAAQPATWAFALFLKCLAWREQGMSWAWSCDSHNPGKVLPNGSRTEDSWGLMQVNVLAHPQYSPASLVDCNQCILAAAPIAWDAWTRANGQVLLAASIYNAGSPDLPANQGYAGPVNDVYYTLAQQTPQLQGA